MATTTPTSHALLPNPAALTLDCLTPSDGLFVYQVSTTAASAVCPLCHQPSERIHSRYRRRLLDLPWQGSAVRFEVNCRKFFCDNSACKRRIFAEPLPTVAERYARKTCRLAVALRELCYLVGGEAAARIACTFGLLVSADALLDSLKQGAAQDTATPASTPRVLGIDDFAFRRGHTYGTILVDLEKRTPVDLLPDREASSVERWLRAHPGVEIVSRDRGNCYIEGATKGAPTAVQVADRWHLLKNLGDALEKFLTRKHSLLKTTATEAEAKAMNVPPPSQRAVFEDDDFTKINVVPCPKDDSDRVSRRQRRVNQYEQVTSLHKSGMNLSGIARQTGLCRTTIRTYLRSDGFPERRERTCGNSKLTPFRDHLRQRFGEGCHSAVQLHEEIQKRGFTGKHTIVKGFVATLRTQVPRLLAAEEKQERKRRVTLSPRRLSWLLTNQDSPKVTDADRETVRHLTEAHPEVSSAATLGTQFCAMVRERKASELPEWLDAAKQSGIAELRTFAVGLIADRAAVEAALSLAWSNGQTEGQVNRLKFLKRQMYGRASFDLLRARVVPNL